MKEVDAVTCDGATHHTTEYCTTTDADAPLKTKKETVSQRSSVMRASRVLRNEERHYEYK